MEHSFNVNIAAQYGIHTAILLKNLHFWIEKNKANNKHFYDGRYWTYNSKKAFSELFPYLTERQVKYTLEKMKKDDLILVGNYNQNSYDKTNWYSLTDKALTLLECNGKTVENAETIDRTKLSDRADNGVPIDWTKLSNRADEIVQSYNGTNVNSYIIKESKKEKKESISEKPTPKKERRTYNQVIEEYTDNENLRTELKEFLKVLKLKNSLPTNYSLDTMLNNLSSLAYSDEAKIAIVKQSIIKSWKDFYPINHLPYYTNKQTSERETSYDLSDYESDDILEMYVNPD